MRKDVTTGRDTVTHQDSKDMDLTGVGTAKSSTIVSHPANKRARLSGCRGNETGMYRGAGTRGT